MDAQVIDQKLESLRRCLMRIESKQPFDAEQLADDFDLQDIVSLNLTRAVQMAVDIGAHIAASQNQPGPATMAETYSTINWQVVHAIIAGHLDDFKDFARAVSLWQLGSSLQAKT